MDLQTAAAVPIPDVSNLPKLLKAHNVGFKEGDNASTWYLRFNNFCLMLGIYLPPPSAMEKNSEMGKEWDDKAVPFVFYSRFSRMERVLSHILLSPDFFPKSMMDELLLNPKPYNFIRLFMALHSNSVPDLSDRVIKRPGHMKPTQSLSQYALSWVNYFHDEANVNGIVYSRYRQYCYFVDGISPKYMVLKKFLEMEFTRSHDRKDNIPISLELRNLPTTIISLCNVHGISIGNANIQQLNALETVDTDDCCDDKTSITDDDSIKKLQSNFHSSKTSSDKSKVLESAQVKCWLCDGPHSFRQCKDLVRVKNICSQRPQVRKHFQQLLLQKTGGDAIKVLLDFPEIFDDSSLDVHDATAATESINDEDHARVNSLHIMNSDVFTIFNQGGKISDVTKFPDITDTTRQLSCDQSPDDDEAYPHQDFFILALSDRESSTNDGSEMIHFHPAEFVQAFDDTDHMYSQNQNYEIDRDGFFISPHADPIICDNQGSSHIDFIRSVSFDKSSLSQVKFHHFTTQVDGGADRCTTPHRSLVDNMRAPDPALGEPLFLYDAGKHKHRIEGIGNFRIESWVDGKASYEIRIPCVYIPTIPSTLVNFRLAVDAIMYGEISNLVTNE
mmetsp:Transcript_3560/g.6720  ORF Transcript_3560/g.6720 Transcript_3560/m.6720 type:complete len:615 (-) Transcript_3560:1923-3767(-)